VTRFFYESQGRGYLMRLMLVAVLLGGWGIAASPSNAEGAKASPAVKVKVVDGGESTLRPEECRGVIVGVGVNQPDPFPGYAGFVGWESPIRLASGDWLVGFNAGYWHASVPTPLQYPPRSIEQYKKMGMPADIEAPTGGRAMIVRSTDEGQTWSKPATLVDTPADDRHPAFVQLEDGTIMASFFTYTGRDAMKEYKEGSDTRVYTIRSHDNGATWDKPRRVMTPFLYDETDGPLVKLADGSVLMAINGRDKSGPPDVAAVLRSTDAGENWELLSSVKGEHDLVEVSVAVLKDGRWVMMARPEGDILWSSDRGKSWTKPVTFGMRMFAPNLYVLQDGTLVCLHGSYAPGAGGLRAIFSTDGGETWVAPAADHGFLVDNSYGYAKAAPLADGSLFIVYLATGGHRAEDAKKNAVQCIRIKVREDHTGIKLLPAPNHR
jgi:photosystem II stability/assembly factor-like uncharacterized protein